MSAIVHTLPQTRLRNAEFLQYHTQVLQEIKNEPTAYNLVKILTDRYGALRSELDAVFVQDRASALTVQIEAADHDRDDYLTGLKLAFKAQTYAPTPEIRQAAHALLHQMDVYGKDIQIQNINAETAILQSLIQDLQTKTELIEALVETGTGGWIAPLKTANDLVDRLYRQRNNEQAANTEALPYTMRQKRLEITEVWSSLSAKIAGHYAINEGAAPWGALVGRINTLTRKYADLLAARRGRNDDDGGDEYPPID